MAIHFAPGNKYFSGVLFAMVVVCLVVQLHEKC